jgi:hypothetical protein
MTALPALLAELEEEWARKGIPLASRLLPGATEDEIRTRLEPVGLTPPMEVVEWYQWRNGATRPTYLMPAIEYASLGEAVDLYVRFGNFPQGWLPFTQLFFGGYHVVQCSDAGLSSAACGYVAKEMDLEVDSIDSLATVVRLWTRLIAEGIWYYDDSGDRLWSRLTEQERETYPRNAVRASYVW